MKNRVIIQLFIGYLISGIGFSLFNSTYILLMTDQKGFNDSQTSIIVGLTALAVLPTSLLWGTFIDRSKKLMKFSKISLVGTIIFTILLLFSNNFYLFFLIYIMRTIAVQPYFSLLSEYTIDKASQMDIRYGVVLSSLSLGWGLAGIIGLFFMNYIGITGMLYLSVVLLIIQLLILNTLPEYTTKIKYNSNEQIKLISNLKLLFKNKKFIYFLFIYTLLISTSGSSTGYGTSSLLIKLNTPQNIITLVPFTLIIFEIFTISNIEKFSFFKKTYISLFLAASILVVRWLIMAITSSYMLVMASLLLHGFSQGILSPLITANVVTMVEERQRSTALLLNSLLQTLFVAIINLLLGQFVPYFGISTYGSLYLIIALICSVFIVSKIKSNKYQKLSVDEF